MNIPEGYLNGEIRDGFYVESTMKKAWAAEIEVLNEVDRICRQYDIQYFEDTYVVTGHTPTQGIMGNPKPGYVYRENHHIAIDCGCNRRNGRLAAVCLDTGREYYVEKS